MADHLRQGRLAAARRGGGARLVWAAQRRGDRRRPTLRDRARRIPFSAAGKRHTKKMHVLLSPGPAATGPGISAPAHSASGAARPGSPAGRPGRGWSRADQGNRQFQGDGLRPNTSWATSSTARRTASGLQPRGSSHGCRLAILARMIPFR